VPQPPRERPAPPRPRVAETPKQEPAKPQQAFDLDSVLRDVQRQRPRQQAEAPPQQARADAPPRPASNAPSNPSQPLSMTEQDAIRQHIERFWNPPVGARDAESLVIEVRVWLDPDGTVRNVQTLDQARKNRDEFYRAAAESAERAVKMASPLPVPRAKHDQFKTLILGFSPKEMLGVRG